MAQKNILLISTRKGLVSFRKNVNQKWTFDQVYFLGIPVTMAHLDIHTNTWWACLDHGHWGCKLHKSQDEGKNWIEVEAPKYDESDEVKEGVSASLNYLWAMENANNKLLIGTEPGGLFSSSDNGASFNLVRGLWNHPSRKTQWFGGGKENPGIHSIVVNPDNDQHIYIAISCAGVFESLDGGISWNPKNRGLKADFLPDPNSEIGQDPHLLVACPSNFNVLWQQNHCGIFRSTDGGDNWLDVSDKSGEANFGFAIATDSKNSEIAWVVPAISDEIRVAVDKSLCICRTEDGGKSWQTFRKGLPQSEAFDITYRHALDQDEETIVFGTTTGNLYISNDHGETWSTISNNLPMVHCVQFI